jgi:hypothetical protein
MSRPMKLRASYASFLNFAGWSAATQKLIAQGHSFGHHSRLITSPNVTDLQVAEDWYRFDRLYNRETSQPKSAIEL